MFEQTIVHNLMVFFIIRLYDILYRGIQIISFHKCSDFDVDNSFQQNRISGGK